MAWCIVLLKYKLFVFKTGLPKNILNCWQQLFFQNLTVFICPNPFQVGSTWFLKSSSQTTCATNYKKPCLSIVRYGSINMDRLCFSSHLGNRCVSFAYPYLLGSRPCWSLIGKVLTIRKDNSLPLPPFIAITKLESGLFGFFRNKWLYNLSAVLYSKPTLGHCLP